MDTTQGDSRRAPIRVLLGDINAAGHQALRAALEPGGFELVGETRNRQALVDMAVALRPAVVIVACDRLSTDVLATAREILGLGRNTHVVLLTEHAGGRRIRVAFRAGIHGWVVKADSARELARAVQIVSAGRMFLSADAGRAISEPYVAQPDGGHRAAI